MDDRVVKNECEEHGMVMLLPGFFLRAQAAVLNKKVQAGSAVLCWGLACPWDYMGPAS